jgi:hypothetical protein
MWSVLAVVTLGLAVYRWLMTARERDVLHLGPGEEREIPEQVELAQKLVVIDKWGKILTVVTVLIGLLLAGGYLYTGWHDPSAAPNNFYRRNTQ